MVRAPYFDKHGMKKGEWSEDEDNKLRAYIQRYGHSNWRQLPNLAGLSRCGKSCRLRWMNYLRPGLKHGKFTKQEEDIIADLHKKHGNKWSLMSAQLPGRSDNEIKNYWHTRMKHHAAAAGKDQTHHHVLMNEKAASSTSESAAYNNPKECLIDHTSTWSLLENQQQEEVETLLAVLSSSTRESSSSCSLTLSVSDYEVTPSEEEKYPFFLDDMINGVVSASYNNMTMYSPFGLAEVENLITTQASFQDYNYNCNNYITDDGLILW